MRRGGYVGGWYVWKVKASEIESEKLAAAAAKTQAKSWVYFLKINITRHQFEHEIFIKFLLHCRHHHRSSQKENLDFLTWCSSKGRKNNFPKNKKCSTCCWEKVGKEILAEVGEELDSGSTQSTQRVMNTWCEFMYLFKGCSTYTSSLSLFGAVYIISKSI